MAVAPPRTVLDSTEETHIAHALELVLSNRWNAIILERMAQFGLADWWLTAGCIAQSVWNASYGRRPTQGILDYDLFYFDPDTSWDAEDVVIRKAAWTFDDLPVTIQIRNQARVPLWYESKFGVPFPPVSVASDGIDRFACKTVAIGVRREADHYRIYAPFSVELLLEGIVAPNPALEIPHIYAEKTRRWAETWPGLTVRPWLAAAIDDTVVRPKSSPQWRCHPTP
jgi:hypothetical protein